MDVYAGPLMQADILTRYQSWRMLEWIWPGVHMEDLTAAKSASARIDLPGYGAMDLRCISTGDKTGVITLCSGLPATEQALEALVAAFEEPISGDWSSDDVKISDAAM